VRKRKEEKRGTEVQRKETKTEFELQYYCVSVVSFFFKSLKKRET
jgi:hypothetical protein